MGDVKNKKQEQLTRLHICNKIIGLTGISSGYQAHCQSRHDLAKYLKVSEPVLQEAIDWYRAKCGFMIELDNYVIFFEPCLPAMETF